MDLEKAKQAAGSLAASFVQDEMIVGLGTGSTANYFIEKLIQRTQIESLRIHIVSSSHRSLEQAQKGGLPIIDINTLNTVDLTVDGADEIDFDKRMIKGGGGALLREKILASMSKEMMVVVDETKRVHQLGTKKLPVEIIPFAYKATLHALSKEGLTPQLRTGPSSAPYVTDNGNYIADIYFSTPPKDPEQLDIRIKEIPGVVETGFFFHLAGRVIVAFLDGQTSILS